MKNPLLKCVFALILSFLSSAVFSQTYQTNPVTGIWNDAASWDNTIYTTTTPTLPPSSTFSTTSSVNIVSGSYITLNGDLNFNAKSSSLTVSGTLVVTGNLYFKNDAQLDGGITIASGGVLVVLGNFTGPNKISISASTSPGNGYFYVAGTTSFNGTSSQKLISGGTNIYYENPPSTSNYPYNGYNSGYNTNPTSNPLPTPIQETIGSNNISVSPSTINGCISTDQSSFLFTLPTATNNTTDATLSIEYQVIRDYNTGSDQQVGGSGYASYSGPTDITITDSNPSSHSYDVLFYLNSPTSGLLTGYKVVPISLSNTPTTGTIQ